MSYFVAVREWTNDYGYIYRVDGKAYKSKAAAERRARELRGPSKRASGYQPSPRHAFVIDAPDVLEARDRVRRG